MHINHRSTALVRSGRSIAIHGAERLPAALVCLIRCGLWFGCWMKQGAIQSVRLLLILISFAALSLVHSAPARSCAANLPALPA